MRHRLPDAERIADREHEVADLNLVGIAEFDRRKALLHILQSQHRKIAALIAQQHLGFEFALVGERHANLVGALDDVMIGDDDAARIDDHARAERALDALAGRPHARQLPAEKAAEKRVVEEGIARALHLALRVDVHHGGCRALHHRGEGE